MEVILEMLTLYQGQLLECSACYVKCKTSSGLYPWYAKPLLHVMISCLLLMTMSNRCARKGVCDSAHGIFEA